MKQSTLALLLGSASATITANFGCNFDTVKANLNPADAAVVTWNNIATTFADTDDAAACETKGKTAVDAVDPKTGLVFCAEFRKDGNGAGKNTCTVKSAATADLSAKGSEANVKLAADTANPAVYAEVVQAVIWDASATVKVPTTTNNDNASTADKMKINMAKKATIDGVTWATAVPGYREASKTRIQSAPACESWCTSKAKAETDMAKKVGVCEFVQTAATAGELGTCQWTTTSNADKITKDSLPIEAKAATANAIYFASFYVANSTPVDAYPAATTTTTTTDDKKKEETTGASSLVAGAAGLMAAALMY